MATSGGRLVWAHPRRKPPERANSDTGLSRPEAWAMDRRHGPPRTRHVNAPARLSALRFRGQLTQDDAARHGCRLITAIHGADGADDHLTLTLLVDATGTVMDGRALTPVADAVAALADGLVEGCLNRFLAEAATTTPREAWSRAGGVGQPPWADPDQAFVVLSKALQQLQPAAAPPAASDWPQLGLFEKVRRIEGVLDTHVRPALASDGGGIDLVDLKEDDLYVQYQGACGSCSSSIGGTLHFIQDSLNNHLGTRLAVKVAALEEAPSLI